jgi:hypothetical protein
MKMKSSRLIEATRKSAVTESGLRSYYSVLENIVKDKCIGTDRYYNVDETGVREGETQASKVLGTSLASVAESVQSDATAWISILEAISARGRCLTPVVIFSGARLQEQWFQRKFPEWKYNTSPSGWSDGMIFLKWFVKLFLPETKPADESQWRLLVLDRHKTHITAELMKKAWLNKVWLSWLSSYSSHVNSRWM